MLLYASQNGVCSAAVGGGDQVRKGVLRVGGFMGKHGGFFGGESMVERRRRRFEGGERLQALTNAVAVKVDLSVHAQAEWHTEWVWLCRSAQYDVVVSRGRRGRAKHCFRGLKGRSDGLGRYHDSNIVGNSLHCAST